MVKYQLNFKDIFVKRQKKYSFDFNQIWERLMSLD